MYKIIKGGKPYLTTVDALLVVNLFSQLVQSGADVELTYDGRVFASTESVKSNSISDGKK